MDLWLKTITGTPRFASPEAAAGRPVDTRGDLYSVGLVLYVLVAGRGPFDHVRGLSEVLTAHTLLIPEPPSRYAAQALPPGLDEVVLKALTSSARPEADIVVYGPLALLEERARRFSLPAPSALDAEFVDVPAGNAFFGLFEPGRDALATGNEAAGEEKRIAQLVANAIAELGDETIPPEEALRTLREALKPHRSGTDAILGWADSLRTVAPHDPVAGIPDSWRVETPFRMARREGAVALGDHPGSHQRPPLTTRISVEEMM